jgi:mRNA interferase RelE/StbE
MTYNIIFIEKAKGEFFEIDIPTQRQIAQFIEHLDDGEDPYSLGSPLEEIPSSYWKFRIGDYRLVAEIQDDLFVVLLLTAEESKENLIVNR